MTLKDNLIAAKALIDTPAKWGKEAFQPRPGCYCALGAVAAAIGHDPDKAWFDRAGRLKNKLEMALMEQSSAFDMVTDFNDHPDTTHADVMALFDRAIAAAG